MTEIELIIDLHKNFERQGPGSINDTIKALKLLDLPDNKKIKVADIGCGSGGQTITLAKHLNGQIVAIDIFQEFLDKLNETSKNLGFNNKITTHHQSMENLSFKKNEFDIIWSEGAIYNIGFENGLKKWRNYLKEDGYLVVTEITWITQSRPKEIETYWNKHYPEINTASNKIKQLESNGYSLVGYFYLNPDSWLQSYYNPMLKSFDGFLKRNNNSELAKKIINENLNEIDLYKKYKEYYSYGFYIAKKTK